MTVAITWKNNGINLILHVSRVIYMCFNYCYNNSLWCECVEVMYMDVQGFCQECSSYKK